MRTAIELVETDGGRWDWAIVAINEDFTPGKLAVSAISFASRADAQIDAQEHLVADVGPDGRAIRTKDQLRNLIRLAADECQDCEDTFFGDIYWHAHDEMGCNWSVSTASGRDWSSCIDCLQPAATSLRQIYNIADEA